MAKRNCRFEVRLTKDEYYDLTKKARRAGLTTGAFVRMAVAGQEVHEAPSVDVPILIREVRRVGSNIDQILKIANGKGLLEVPDLRKALEENRTVDVHVLEDGSDGVRYEICHSTDGHEHDDDQHVHFFCECCRRTFCINDIPIPNVSLPQGYVLESINYMAKGLCPKCASKKKITR